MISKETISKIAGVLKVDVSDFEAKLKSEKEETLEVPVLITEDEKKIFGDNRFNEGKKAASEILVKDLKVKHGLDFEGKSVDALLDHFAEKKIAEAKVAPDEQVKALKGEKKTLQDQIAALAGEKESIQKTYNDKLFQVEMKSQVLSSIPENTIIPREDLVDLFFNRHRVTKENDSTIIYKGDQKLQDNVLNPVPLKDAVKQFSESYIKKDGMGGGDGGGGGSAVPKFKTASQAYQYLKSKNIEPMSEEGLKLLNDNKEAGFDPNN
jgi:ribosomal protein L11